MSFRYWQSKFVGGYVWHKGSFKEVTDLETEEPTPGARLRTPEDLLPFIRFKLRGVAAACRREDFTVIFPEERYVKVEDYIIWGQRSIVNDGWKVVPSRQNYDISHGTFEEWIKAPLTQKTVPIDKILTLKEEVLISQHCAVRAGEPERITLEHCGLPIVTIDLENNTGDILQNQVPPIIRQILRQLEIQIEGRERLVGDVPDPRPLFNRGGRAARAAPNPAALFTGLMNNGGEF